MANKIHQHQTAPPPARPRPLDEPPDPVASGHRAAARADKELRAAAARSRRAVTRLRSGALALERKFAPVLRQCAPAQRASARNLLHYLAVRRHDIRALQNDLAMLGLSSLGRMEAHTLASLDAVQEVLGRMCGRPAAGRDESPPPCSIREGSAQLARHADAILGPSPPDRMARIMVTLPSEAADDPAYIRELLRNGMDIMRINCAHDGPAHWERMIRHLRNGEKAFGRKCLVSFDLAGPKLRTGPIQPGLGVIKWRPKRNRLGQVAAPARIRFCSALNEGEPGESVVPVHGKLVGKARAGDQIVLVDARGRKRSLRVVESAGIYCIGEARRTAYVTPRTKLTLRRGKRAIAHGEVAELPPVPEAIQLSAGDMLEIASGEVTGRPVVLDAAGRTISPAVVGCSLPEVFRSVKPGQRVFLDDGRICGVVRAASRDRLRVEITSAVGGTAKLRDEKGINLPDTELRLPAMTAKDRQDLAFAVKHADIVALSFVQRPEDVEDLRAALRRLNASRLGIMLKIETRRAFAHLPALLLGALRHPRLSVMVARGDLGVEVGFERLSEVQEEILWLCEAAHVPVVWATQVLESLAKGGMPSRAEVTDAAMGGRAECVMLNKGPYILKTLKFLCNVLTRMQAHQSKKTPLLRKLKVSDLRRAAK